MAGRIRSLDSKDNDYAEAMARREYEYALRRAFWRNLRHRLAHRCNDLLPTGKVLERLDRIKQRNLSKQKVAIEDIVGSTGRYRDFDLVFLPRRKETDDRWVSIARAHYLGINLPPPRLFRMGDAYFVEDGNHRVSVARARGQEHIEAFVVMIDSSTLIPDPSCQRLGFDIPGQAHRCNR